MKPIFRIRLAACAVAALFHVVTSPSTAQDAPPRQWYELRHYQLSSPEAARDFDAAMRAAGIPGYRSIGTLAVGVFQPRPAPNGDTAVPAHHRYVLVAYPTLEALQGAATRLGEQLDESAREAARAYLMAGKDAPAFARVDSVLLLAFTGMPALVDPADANAESRFFELRKYESHSEMKAKLKVDMFNEGELDIFREVGLTPVFMGEAVVGGDLPYLAYMLAYDTEDDHAQAWDRFRNSPAWDTLKNDPKYADTVSKIDSVFLVALPYSEIR